MTDLNQIVIEAYFAKVRLMQLGDASDEEYIELAKKLVKELEKVDRINSYKGTNDETNKRTLRTNTRRN